MLWEKRETTISYEKEKGTLTTDRTCSGLKKDLLCTRSMYVDTKEGKLKLRLLLDKYTVELFVNDGEQAMTSLIYTPLEAEGISFSCKGETVLDITKYVLFYHKEMEKREGTGNLTGNLLFFIHSYTGTLRTAIVLLRPVRRPAAVAVMA